VVDISSPNYEQQIKVVEQTLERLDLQDKNTILVLNKMDQLSPKERNDRKKHLRHGVLISAKQHEGLNDLVTMASHYVSGDQGPKEAKGKKIKAEKNEEVVFDERRYRN
jgi:GTP-binding protein HflX